MEAVLDQNVYQKAASSTDELASTAGSSFQNTITEDSRSTKVSHSTSELFRFSMYSLRFVVNSVQSVDSFMESSLYDNREMRDQEKFLGASSNTCCAKRYNKVIPKDLVVDHR